MTQQTRTQNLHTTQDSPNAKPNPSRKRKLADTANGISAIADRHMHAALGRHDTDCIREKMMKYEWYRNAVAKSGQEGPHKNIAEDLEKIFKKSFEESFKESFKKSFRDGVRVAHEAAIEQRRLDLLNIAGRFLSPETCTVLAFIKDLDTLEAAFEAACEANAR
ncbi:MAG: hypothetical protein FWD57_05225 [Polyangiaceae bacterium]|nr:hypothetical protein [Polyangiaceae bacterium]